METTTTKQTVQIKRTESAGRSWGSPGNNFKTSAKYDIVIDGVVKGRTYAAGRLAYMDKAVWEIVHWDGAGIIRPLKTIWNGGLKAAKQWSQNNPDKF